jgi:hypothetical protein
MPKCTEGVKAAGAEQGLEPILRLLPTRKGHCPLVKYDLITA